MTTIIIEDKSPQAKKLIDYIKSLPFVTVVDDKDSFQEAAENCQALTVDEFFDDLDNRIKKRFDHAPPLARI